ncbi:MFS transporter [Alcaligenes pakistanensis]|uniref:MFS transporter n=1 Tax=Alcaligenes pakistanensis TaxID=1482717 RepID=A0A8H9M984_9BURK|nr:MFS transporter [Alcaligenes pakistanensis]GHC51915.1 MFS transporter [Alcaligenes pakistanensis]HCA18076.1 MFS transporter [Alcaligenes faecalis]
MSTHQTMNTAGARPARLSLTPQERKASILLALLFACRMLGLFLLTPVFAVAAHSLPGGNDAARVGLALGAYGLTQAVLQIPLGMASDRFGRRPIIVIGMALFVIGGVISAMAQSIDWVTVGRCVQGLGAVSAAISAWVADSTRPEVRTRAMAMVGGSIGLSFAVSLVLSPVLVGQFGLSGLFWAISLLGFVCLLVAAFVVPSAPKAPASIVQVTAGQVLRHMDLLRLNFGVFCLHFILMSLFIVVPGILATLGGYGTQDLWKVYLPVILVSFVLMVPAVFWTETRKRHKQALELAVLLLVVVLAVMPWARASLAPMVAALTFFFIGFNILEALQPSLVSRVAPPEYKGLALGFYNTSQSLGVFAGGLIGGVLAGQGQIQWVLWVGAGLALLWLLTARGFKDKY